MKLQIKKIIAREFLILTITIGIGLLIYGLTFPYNLYRKNNADNLGNKITSNTILADSLSKQFDVKTEKHKWLVQKFKEEFDFSSDTSFLDTILVQLDIVAQQDSIKYRWDAKKSWIENWTPFFKKIGFNNPNSLKQYVLANIIDKSDIENKNKAREIEAENIKLESQKIENQNKLLQHNEQVKFGIGALIICLILLFALRYIVYAVIWSLKTLKQK